MQNKIEAFGKLFEDNLYEYFKELMSAELKHVGCGVFGAHMEVDMLSDGPVTIVMDSERLRRGRGK